jgi:hypothetical protein
MQKKMQKNHQKNHLLIVINTSAIFLQWPQFNIGTYKPIHMPTYEVARGQF